MGEEKLRLTVEYVWKVVSLYEGFEGVLREEPLRLMQACEEEIRKWVKKGKAMISERERGEDSGGC